MSRTIDDLFKLQETAYKSHTADIAAIRREQTRATINFSRRLDALTGEGLTANDALLALTSKKVNKLVDSAEFMLPVGPGCETEVDFSGKWVALMRSHRLNNKLKLGLSVANMEEINDMGADIDEHTWSLFRTVVLHNAVRVGKVAPKFNDDEENDTDRDGNDAWAAMEHEEQESFLKAFFVKGGPIRKYLGELISKARTEKMNADLKRLARETMPKLIPFTNDPTADKYEYDKVKKPFDERDKAWPRMCLLTSAQDGEGVPQFLHVPRAKEQSDGGSDEELDADADDGVQHPFHDFHAAVVQHWGIESPSKFLKAYLVSVLNDIVKVEMPTKGHGKKRAELAYGEMTSHDHLTSGITAALAFMADRKRCPTTDPDIKALQSAAKKAKGKR